METKILFLLCARLCEDSALKVPQSKETGVDWASYLHHFPPVKPWISMNLIYLICENSLAFLHGSRCFILMSYSVSHSLLPHFGITPTSSKPYVVNTPL